MRLSQPRAFGEALNLFFRDHRGVYWRRDPLGRLTELASLRSDNGDGGRGRLRQIEDEIGEGPSDASVGILIPKPLADEDAT